MFGMNGIIRRVIVIVVIAVVGNTVQASLSKIPYQATLETRDKTVNVVELKHPFIQSELIMPGMKQSSQIVSVEVVNHTEQPQLGMVKAQIPGMEVSIEQSVRLESKETKIVTFSPEAYAALVCQRPKLWWPMNKGPQNLYELVLTYESKEQVLDTKKTRFAVRHVTSDCNTPDKSRQIYVNGKSLFLYGMAWMSETLSNATQEQVYAAMRYTQQAGLNFLQLGADNIGQLDYLFDLCDEIGILVAVGFENTDLNSVTDTVKLIRNHASLISYNANDSVKDTVMGLDNTCRCEVDWNQSNSSRYVNPMFYYDDSEAVHETSYSNLGTVCLPPLDSLKEVMDEEDIWPVNKKVWDSCDGNTDSLLTQYIPAITQYGPIKNAKDLAWKGQLVGAVAARSRWESWMYNRLDSGNQYTSGVCIASPNDSMRLSGGMWDQSLEPTAALYYSQDAHEPIHAQYDFVNNTVSVNNEYNEPFVGSVVMRLYNLNLKLMYENSATVVIKPDHMENNVIQADMRLTGITFVHFIRLDVYDMEGKAISDTFYWRSGDTYKGLGTNTGPLYAGFETLTILPKIRLYTDVLMQSGQCRVTVQNPSTVLAFMVRVKLVDDLDKPVRPTFYSDNYFHIMPQESKTLIIESDHLQSAKSLVVDGWNVKESVISFVR